MSKNVVITQLDIPVLKNDTRVETTSTGELQLVTDARGVQTTVGALADGAAKTFREALCDPKREEEFVAAVDTINQLADTRQGISDTVPDLGHPPSTEKVAPATEKVLVHKVVLCEVAPTAAQQMDWDGLKRDLAWERQLVRTRTKLQVRAKNTDVLLAHVRRRLFNPLSGFFAVSQTAIRSHRGLESEMNPLIDLFTGAAQQGVETKKEIARALAQAKTKDAEVHPAPAAVTPPVVIADPKRG